MAVCKLTGENYATYFTDGGQNDAYDRQAIRDAAATVISEENYLAEQRRKSK